MESKEAKVELINLAIKKFIEEKKNNKDASSQDDQLFLSNLLSQLESVEGDRALNQPRGVTDLEVATSPDVGEVETKVGNTGNGGSDGAEISSEDIMNELRHVKRQNFITHCLLSVMIVVTFAWQLSEVKLILKVRDGLNHPFRSVGNMLTGMFKGPGNNGQDAEHHQIEAPPLLPPLKIPELVQCVMDVKKREGDVLPVFSCSFDVCCQIKT